MVWVPRNNKIGVSSRLAKWGGVEKIRHPLFSKKLDKIEKNLKLILKKPNRSLS